MADFVHPRLLRYVHTLPVDGGGSHGGARLLSLHAVQPHEGIVELAGSVGVRGRRRALASSVALTQDYVWACQDLRSPVWRFQCRPSRSGAPVRMSIDEDGSGVPGWS
ncbi:hypothetical protein GCM10023175_58130 [Pseudonocardia xishanensis]|uniref:Uncharacterized protein n=1 Tax=Pseudonocardia xishanensis TaxID=630995 RepID=A0ABP8S216_9PSEU